MHMYTLHTFSDYKFIVIDVLKKSILEFNSSFCKRKVKLSKIMINIIINRKLTLRQASLRIIFLKDTIHQ